MHSYIFVGPSSTEHSQELLSRLPDVTVCAPARRGDIARIIAEHKGEPSRIAVVDGIFHVFPAVGHAEILSAIRAGWQVWGLSSMGAIRAFEMSNLGMLGFGSVYQMFSNGTITSDDEVALIHSPDEPYTNFTHPLVHLRASLAWLTQTKALEPTHAKSILLSLQDQWYGYRTMELFEDLLEKKGITSEQIQFVRDNFSQFCLKAHDFEAFIEEVLCNS
jgi:hypothetical protein